MTLPNYKVLVPHRPFHTEPQMTAFVAEVLQMETILLVDPLNLELNLVYLTVIQMLRCANDVVQLKHLLQLQRALTEVAVVANGLPQPLQCNDQHMATHYRLLMERLTPSE